MAKLMYGVYVNLSVWFKIKDKTIFGTYFATIGALITLAGHFILVAQVGYVGSAITALVCYTVMCLMCYFKGRQIFPVPYRFGKPLLYLIMALIIIYASNLIELKSNWWQYAVDLFITLAFMAIMYLLEGRRFKYKS